MTKMLKAPRQESEKAHHIANGADNAVRCGDRNAAPGGDDSAAGKAAKPKSTQET